MKDRRKFGCCFILCLWWWGCTGRIRTLIDFQSHIRISVDEDCVPSECIGHRHIVIKWVVLRMLCMKKFLKVFNIGNVLVVVSKKVLVLWIWCSWYNIRFFLNTYNVLKLHIFFSFLMINFNSNYFVYLWMYFILCICWDVLHPKLRCECTLSSIVANLHVIMNCVVRR
jgi:hypothetical protein